MFLLRADSPSRGGEPFSWTCVVAIVHRLQSIWPGLTLNKLQGRDTRALKESEASDVEEAGGKVEAQIRPRLTAHSFGCV